MSPPQVPRRALLTGAAGAGLLAGIGGTVLERTIASGSSGGSSAAPAAPGEELMTEHGVLKRVLLAYRAIIERFTTAQTVARGPIIDSAQLISDYVEGFHEGLEEAYVFPRVAARQPDLIRTLLIQHDRGRHLTADILTAAAGDLARPSVRDRLSADLTAFVRMYEPHEAWEDTVVYPDLRRNTPQRTLDLLAERFADLENKQYGDDALAQMLARVGGVEQQLGIDDLAAFTPAD